MPVTGVTSEQGDFPSLSASLGDSAEDSGSSLNVYEVPERRNSLKVLSLLAE